MPVQSYDIFLSFSGTDRVAARELAGELRALGLRVFLDEDEIEAFTGITDGVQESLRTAKTLVAYYSAAYSRRRACQQELMEVFLAGQREGDPCGRIMVINPEPGTEHLRPVELADARFVRAEIGPSEIARQIMKRAVAVEGTIGEILPVKRPGWPTRRTALVKNFVGRYRELWDLHSALHAANYSLIDDPAAVSVVSVCGLPGVGKTALVATYFWRFAAAFPGGIHWVSMEDVLRDQYVRDLRHHVPNCLWVVDDVPADLGTSVLDLLPHPTENGTRTVLITDEDIFRDLLPVVRLDGLPMTDAADLLDAYRLPDSRVDRDARDRILLSLGGNPAALVALGKYLQDRHGLSSYLSLASEAETFEQVTGPAIAPVRKLIDRMSEDELALLRLADRSARFVFPARYLANLPSLAALDVGTILKNLLTRSAATRDGTVWRLDPLVVRAASAHRRLVLPRY
ncbi:TIR domain-containing protein [Saccharopolyspora sp. 5N708]|uniref:TIR domain-containing protein n=1 Tax=Saccharopolyspora sp. 5N708 TaxID=3457424 RepID=UPI003FD3C8D5